MSYVKSLRFKLMLLCAVPLFLSALMFIAYSYVIAAQVSELTLDTYSQALVSAGASASLIQAIESSPPDTSWVNASWIIMFFTMFVIFYIPITICIRKIIFPIRKLAAGFKELANGNIHIDVNLDRTDEIGVLQSSFHELVMASRAQAELLSAIADGDISGSYIPRSDADLMGYSLLKVLEHNNQIMSQLSDATGRITLTASHIADGSNSLATGSTQQSSSLNMLATTIGSVAETMRDNAQQALKAARLAGEVKQSAEAGVTRINHMVSAVKDIRDSSNSISKVIKVIDDIAFQTNILALNAAVEAAKAGSGGSGFAIVAEEVGTLATKSAEAAKDTANLLASSISKADMGVKIAEETADAFVKILSGIEQNSEILSEIARLSESQQTSVGDINEGIKQVSQVVSRNSATAQEYAAASQEMSGQADAIDGLVSRFVLRSS